MIDINMTEDDIEFLAKQNLQLPLNSNELKKYLPHRYPFVLIDRVTHISTSDSDESINSNSIVGYKNISNNEPFVTGHFPDHPIFPGVYMIEAMAQLSGILGFITDKTDLSAGSMYLFAGVDKVRFKQQVIPGDQLVIQANALKVKRNIYTYSTKAYVNDKLVSSAEIMLVKQVVQP